MGKKRYITVMDAFNQPFTLDTKKVRAPRRKKPQVTWDAFVQPVPKSPSKKK